MSSKRIPLATRKVSGRIKYDDDLNLSFNKVGASDTMCSKTISEEDNQDVIRNGESSSSELEISSTNFPLQTQTEIVQDISGVNVDEWFKQRTESVSSMDLEAVMKNEGMDTTYLTENIGHNFLSNKDVDMTCIVTNICDMGLGLDLPTTSASSKTKPDLYVEKDCDNVILDNYSSNQDPLLNDLNRNDILDKDILDENTGISNTDKVPVDLLRTCRNVKEEKQDLYVIESNEELSAIEEEASQQTKQCREGFKENLWNGSEITETQPLIESDKEKTSWESLSVTSKRSTDADSEKEIDFPDFNLGLITFQIDSSDGVCNIIQPTQVESINGEALFSCTSTTTSNSDSSNGTNNGKNDTGITFSLESIPKEVIELVEADATSIAKIPAVPAPNPRSVLKSPLKSTEITKRPSILRSTLLSSNTKSPVQTTETSQENPKKGNKKAPNMAVIAISTDKSKNTTEIVINTPHGEQVFKGKTSDLMKATSGLWQKMDNNKLSKVDQQPLTISMQPAVLEGDVICDTGETPEEVEEFGDTETAEEERPVVEALAELGIEKDNIFCVTTATGQKVWLCPIKDCGKMYQRQSMLKVHILSHFNVRPYRCDVAGCQWSFYTYFKLKRHKDTHLKRKDFVCPKQGCGRRFTTIYNLNTHQKLHERPLEMVCPIETCAARFQTKRNLELHMKTHDKDHAPYKCTYEGCGKHYYSLNSLNSHSRSHQHKEEEVRCQWEGCGKLFDKPCRMKAHMRTHTGDKPYPCTYQDCGWAFSSASKLKRHQYKHTNERKFQCVVQGCSKSFMRSEHLKEHVLTHVGQRNFQCPFENCGVKFSAKSSLYVHLKKHTRVDSTGSDKVMYHCPIEQCSRMYTSKSSLRQHMLKLHTPVLANDPSQLDFIALLAGDDDLATLEGLQFSGDVTPSGANSMNAVSLVTPSSVMMSGDTVGSIPPEFISTDFQVPTFLPTQICATTSSGTNTGVVTHVVFTQPDTQTSTLTMLNPVVASVETSSTVDASVETDGTMDASVETTMDATVETTVDVSVETTSEIGVATDQTLNMPLFEPVSLDMDAGPSNTFGSARTSYTYQDIVRERDRRKGNISPAGMRVPTDVVLGTGLHDITQGFLLQDDIQSISQSLYPEDQMMMVSSGVGEFQVLLLDSTSSTHEFAESTINLRDLE